MGINKIRTKNPSVIDLDPDIGKIPVCYKVNAKSNNPFFEKTVAYAKSNGLVAVEDAKRNDIGNTARAYADGHLGCVELLDGSCTPSFDADFLTVTPF